MSLGLSRALLRRPRFHARPAFRRPASTTSTTAAQDAAAAAKAKTQDGIARVAASAGDVAGKVGTATAAALGGIGGRTGRLIVAVQSLIPPTIYYSRVALELSKIVFRQRQMSPPSVEVFQSYFNSYLQFLRNPSSILSSASSGGLQSINPLRYIRTVSNQQLATAGVILAEVIGFFTVGEIIGKFKIIGYRSSEVKHSEGL